MKACEWILGLKLMWARGRKACLLSFNSDSGTSKKMRLVVDSTDVEMPNDATA